MRRFLARLPAWLAAFLTYVLVAAALLAPALRPGHTVVPVEIPDEFSPLSFVAQPHVHNSLVSDTSLQFYPWFRAYGESIRAGHLPEWNPYVLGGVPFTPNGYVSVYYPPFLLAAAADPLYGYTLFILLHLVIAAMGVYAFARVLGVRPVAAWLGGLATFGALHWIHWALYLPHYASMAWFPAVLAATEWTIARPGRRQIAVLALVFGLWWLGEGFQYAYFGTVALACYGAVSLVRHARREGRWGARLGAAVAGGALGGALAAPLLVPTAALDRHIVRAHESVAAMADTHFPLVDLLQLVLPDARGNVVSGVLYRGYPYGFALDSAFFGVTALLLACAGLGALRRRDLALVAGTAAVLLLAFTGWPHRYLHDWLPGYDRFRSSSRWLSLLPAFALPLAALGAAGLLGGNRRARRGLVAGAALAGAALLAYTGYVASDSTAPHGFFARVIAESLVALAATVTAGFLARTRSRLAVGILAAVLFECGFHSAPWFPSVSDRVAYPATPVASMLAGRGGRIVRVTPDLTTLGPFPPLVPMVYGVEDAEGISVLFPSDYDRYLRLIDDYGDYALITNGAPPLRSAAELRSPLLRALNVRSALVDPAIAMPAGAKAIASAGFNVYPVRSLGPARLVPRAVPATEGQMWAAVARPGWNPAASAAVLGLPAKVDGGTGRVELLSGSDAHEVWGVVAPKGGLLRVSANMAPGWTARIDGRSTPVYRADGIYRSVVVPPGAHEVSFSYANPDEARGRDIGGVALLAVAALLLPLPRRRRRRRGRRGTPDGADPTLESTGGGSPPAPDLPPRTEPP